MAGFEMRISGVGSNWSTNCATTAAQLFCCLTRALEGFM